MGYAGLANAAVDYEGYAELTMTLDKVTSVTQGGGNGNDNVTEGWSVTSSGSIFGQDASFTGTGLAAIDIGVDADRSWSIGDGGLLQYSDSFGGISGAGSASSYGDTGFSILVQNNLDTSLNFEFSYSSFVESYITTAAIVSGEDAVAYAEVSLADSFSDNLLFSSADVFVGGPEDAFEAVNRALIFTLKAGESNTIFGTVYTDGSALGVSQVPIPAAAWLFGSGLLGLVGLRRKSKQA
jgi:hypothetical protein